MKMKVSQVNMALKKKTKGYVKQEGSISQKCEWHLPAFDWVA